jgi:carboxylate-amine ligase
MSAPSATALRAAYDAPAPMTVGVEEELMLLDRETLDLVPRAPEVVGALTGDARFKLELPASQLEIVLPPLEGAADVARALRDGRRALLEAAGPAIRPAALALHPFAAEEGPLNVGERYRVIEAEYGPVARRQLLCALQVHVAVRGADRALAVHDAVRSYLPDVAALAAAAPFHGGRDTGHASWRPQVADLLPRHGIPPALRTWEAYAEALAPLTEPGQWWWDVRPHPVHATLEVRVPDAQASIADAEAVVAVVHALLVWLARRHAAGEALPVEATEPIAARRAVAGRDGLADPATRDRVAALLEALEPVAAEIGGARGLARARTILAGGGLAAHHRALARHAGIRGLTMALADAYEPAKPG